MNLETLNQIFPQHRLGSGTPVILTERQVRVVAEKAGFKPGVAKQMAQIARGESSFQPGVVSNDGGYGLWQMTPRVWGPEAIKHMNKLGGLKAMSNPLLNAKMAKWLYDRGGFDPWYGTKYLDRNLDTSKVRSVLNASDRRKGYIAAVQDGQPQTRRDITTTIEPGGQDIEGALMDMLLSGSGKVERVGSGNSLLRRLTNALDSGRYDRPDVITKHTTESQVPGVQTSGLKQKGAKVKGLNLQPHGGWGGSAGPLKSLIRAAGGDSLQLTSAKRNNQNPYSGKGSDHDFGNKAAFAEDRSNGGAPTPQMDEYAYRLMHLLGFKNYKKGTPINTSQGKKIINGIQYQVIYRGSGAAFGGNHLNHVHVGAHRVS